jgi:integrase/recombinase XerD
LTIVKEWIAFLVENKLWGPEDPLFPATKIGQDGERHFCAVGFDRRGWADAGPIRDVFRRAFPAAGIPCYHPHSLRKTLAQLGERLCRTPEEFKAWSQNLGHEKVMTTFSSYGAVAPRRQGEIMKGISLNNREAPEMSAVDLAQLNQLVQKIAGRAPARD